MTVKVLFTNATNLSEIWSLTLRLMFDGSGCVPVDAPVFKIGGRSRRASGGGFDSHPLPLVTRRGLLYVLGRTFG